MKITATADLVKITPETASEWLSERWGEQRTVRIGHINRLAADMSAGRFKISPDAILRIKGKLANGQHRLEAVVVSGKPQLFLVMESNDEELYKVIDAGLRRSVSDGLIGVAYAGVIPSIARCVQAYDSGVIRAGARNSSEIDRNKAVPTQVEQIDYCQANQEILCEAACFVTSLYEQVNILQRSIGGAIYIIGSKRGKLDKAKEFLTKVYVEGGNNSAGDLRNRLIANRGSKSKLNAGYIFGLTLKSFKSFCLGTRPGSLKWSSDESFPEI